MRWRDTWDRNIERNILSFAFSYNTLKIPIWDSQNLHRHKRSTLPNYNLGLTVQLSGSVWIPLRRTYFCFVRSTVGVVFRQSTDSSRILNVERVAESTVVYLLSDQSCYLKILYCLVTRSSDFRPDLKINRYLPTWLLLLYLLT